MASQNDLFDNNSQVVINADAEGEGNDPEGGDEGMETLVNGAREANDYNCRTRQTVKWKEGEMSIIVDSMEENLELLAGHTKGNEYRRKRINAWKKLMNSIHLWNEQNQTGVVRSYQSTYNKLNNLKARSKYFDKDLG